mgnify:CR=1 FL=1
MFGDLFNTKYAFIGGTGTILIWFATNIGVIASILVALTTVITLIWKFTIDKQNAELLKEKTMWELKILKEKHEKKK